MTKIAIVGCGKMGEAIANGLSGSLSLEVIAVSVRRPEKARVLAERLGVPALTDNVQAVGGADVVVLGVKPQMAAGVLADPLLVEALKGKVLVSICAGVTLGQLAEWVPQASVIRAMPNTPALINQGMTVLAPAQWVTAEELAMASAIFSAVGRVRVLEEKHLDAVTGLSGSGPAFACVILEALADGGVRMGLPRDVAIELAAQTFQGAARLVLETGKHPAELKDEVTTPAGCTIAGLLIMEDGRLRSTLARTIEEAARVAKGLGD